MPLKDYLSEVRTTHSGGDAPKNQPPVRLFPEAAPGDMMPGAIAAVPKLYPAGPTGFSFLYQELSTLSALVDAGGSSGDFSESSSVPQTFWPGAFGCPFSVIATGFAGATVELSFGKHNTLHSGITGMHMGKTGAWNFPVGLTLDIDGVPQWDTIALDYTTNDLILAYSHTLGVRSDNFRFRADTAQCALGRVVGQPSLTGAQLQVDGGVTANPVAGVSSRVFGNQFNFHLIQGDAPTERVKIGFGGPGFQMGLDSAQNDTRDFWVSNDATGVFSLLIGVGDEVTVGSTAGTSSVKLMGLNGFHGATPVAKPASNADLRAGLLSQGLITGGANPLNCNGGLLTSGGLKSSGAIGGSLTPTTLAQITATFTTDADKTLTGTDVEASVITIATDAVLTAGRNLIVQGAAGSIYLVRNTNAQIITVKTSGGTGIAIGSGKFAILCSPGGVNILRVTPDT